MDALLCAIHVSCYPHTNADGQELLGGVSPHIAQQWKAFAQCYTQPGYEYFLSHCHGQLQTFKVA